MKAKRKLFLLLTCAVLCISLTSCSVVESTGFVGSAG